MIIAAINLALFAVNLHLAVKNVRLGRQGIAFLCSVVGGAAFFLAGYSAWRALS